MPVTNVSETEPEMILQNIQVSNPCAPLTKSFLLSSQVTVLVELSKYIDSQTSEVKNFIINIDGVDVNSCGFAKVCLFR